MRITLDPDVDAAYIYLTSDRGTSVETVPAGPQGDEHSVMLDYDASGRLLGVEVLSASAVLSVELLSQAVPPGEHSDA